MLLGAHMSIAGGVDKAFDHGERVGCDAIQIFTKSSNQWEPRPLKEEEITQFKLKQEKTGIAPVVAHDSYLINLCSPDKVNQKKSIDAFQVEMERCRTLEIPYLVMHPGSHLGQGEEWGLETIASNLNNLINQDLAPGGVMILLETTAGQGTNLGYKFEHLKAIMDLIEAKDRIGVCIDTAHVLAAGYDIRTSEGFESVLSEFDSIVGLENLKAIHLNDSKKEYKSRVDRHEQIGKGFVGLEAFRYLMNRKDFNLIPMLLETPKDKDNTEDIENLKLLRSLIM
jgi:deoxyribonuclease-4